MSDLVTINSARSTTPLSGATSAAVIGSGFGGLAAAIRLQSAGVQTTLYEARDKPGGRAYVFEDQGFIFDAGPTVITAPQCLEELFELTGRAMADYVEMLPVAPFYRLLWPDGDAFDYVGDTEHMADQIAQRNPDDVAGYRRFVDYAKEVFEAGYRDLAAAPFLRFRDMVSVAPQLMRLRADRSVFRTVAKYVKNDHVRQALSFHSLLVGGNPFETSSIYTLIHHLEREWGVFFPRGGTGALVQALVRLFEELGGTLHLSSPVDHVEIETGGPLGHRHLVHSPRGVHGFDLVVSNADIHHTYSKLYGHLPAGARMTRKLEKMDWSMSLFVLYFGTDRPYRDDVAHHTVIFGERYKELLDEIFHGDELPEDFSLYLHAPTHTDPSLAPEGCGTFYVLAPVPHLGHVDMDWDEAGDAYADKILAALESHLPDLREHIVTKRWMTPRDFQRDLSAYQGAAFSVSPTLTQSAWFRPHNRDDRIPGLYAVGAGTHPGAGVPGVVNSAKATAGVVLDDLARTGVLEARPQDALPAPRQADAVRRPRAADGSTHGTTDTEAGDQQTDLERVA
ncbi:MAG: phytoene desaturase [Myxococcales bacterium]|nr:phytoene desaturase [Myxococcales bacterium]